MKARLGLLASVLTIAGGLSVAALTSHAADAPCVTKQPKTQLLKDACAKGGQKAAKDAMKAWSKEKGIKSCNACHSKLAPNYELKPDGLAQFQKAGGR